MKNLTCTLLAMFAILTLAAKEPIANIASKKLFFIENKGQIIDQYKQHRKDIDFKLDGGGMTIFCGAAKLHYQWSQYTGKPGDSNMQVNTYRMDVQLVGANPKAQLVKEEVNSYYENHYSPRLKDGMTAKSYSRMVYKNIYPQIDWIIYCKGSELKYDFVVHKGGNPADIRLQYNGATATQLKNGAFTATTPMGSITEEAPYSYEAATQKPVASAYKLQDGVLSFDVVKQDADVVIDPNLVWATYYGGSGYDYGGQIAADDSGKIYFTGSTNSVSNIATTGAYSATKINSYENFLVCMNESCVRLWATYYGISTNSVVAEPVGLAIDTINNSLYVCGNTQDTVNVSTPGAHQVAKSGGYDAYLMKFNFSGFRVWGTYYGGSGSENYATDVETDPFGNVYLSGTTQSTNSIATTGAYNTTLPTGGIGGFLVKFNGVGVRQWGTYLCIHEISGSIDDGLNLTSDISGNVYVAGRAIGSCAVGTAGTHSQFPIEVGGNDIWLGKFNSSGSLIWATFYGGQGLDAVTALAVSDIGDVYMGGATYSDTGIATSTGFRTTKYVPTWYDGFIVRFNNLGRRVWGTYVGDSIGIGAAWGRQVNGIKVSENSRIVVSGVSYNNRLTASNDLVTAGGFQPIRNSTMDEVVGILDLSGKRLWGSFIGGNQDEGYFGVGFGSGGLVLTKNNIYMVGLTSSTNLLAYGSGIHQNFNAGITDAYVVKIELDTFVAIRHPFTDTSLCVGDSFKVKTSVNHPFRSTNVFTVQLSNASGSFASPTVIGAKTANGNDSIKCFIPLTTVAGSGYRIRIVTSAPADTSETNGFDIRIKQMPTAVLATSNSPVCVDDTIKLYGSSSNTDVNYSWSGVGGFSSGAKDTVRANVVSAYAGNYVLAANRQGCIVKDTVTIQVRQRPSDTAVASSNSPVCTNGTINLSGASTTVGVSYLWKGPGGYTSTVQSPSRGSAVVAYSGYYRLSTVLNGCPSTYYDSVYVTVYPPTTAPTPSANAPVCVGQDLQLGASNITGATYAWTSTTGFTSAVQNPVRSAATTAYAGKYYVTATVNGCTSARDSVTVTVNPAPVINVYPSPKDSICVGQSVTFVSSNSNAGTSYTRSWFKNSNVIGGAANANYNTTAAADGDEYYVTLTAYGVCATPFTDTSNVIKMHVLPYLAPAVSITANPNATVTSGTMINFTATPTNGGGKPGYQWTRNGMPVVGAISNVWGASTLSNNDLICVDMTSSYVCPNPKTAKSNCIKVSIESTGIAGIWTGKEPNIYPNPAKDKLIIEGIEKGTKIQFYDVIGRVVIKEVSTATTTELNMSHFVPGSYVLILSTDTGDRMTVKVVKE